MAPALGFEPKSKDPQSFRISKLPHAGLIPDSYPPLICFALRRPSWLIIISHNDRKRGLTLPSFRSERDAMKDYRMWVEVAERKRKCHRCDGGIDRGVMFVRSGDRERPKGARTLCASCFEEVMDDLSHDFQEMNRPSAAVQLADSARCADGLAMAGPRCFACGMSPERCRCGHEAYR